MQNLLAQRPEIKNWEEFDDHQAVYSFNDEAIGLKGFIGIHRKNGRLPSFGATRLWNYNSPDDALRDALGLARTMSYKSAMAGLPYGGAKAVIIGNDKWQSNRVALLGAYAAVVDELAGAFITGTDVGLNQDDLRVMGQASQNLVGFNNNATDCTAQGVLNAMSVCLEKVFGTSDIAGRKFAIQGLGKIGTALARLLYKNASEIYVSEVNQSQLEAFKKEFPECIVVPIEEIHKQAVDVFSPCALSHCVTLKVANELQCKIVCGGANNQLEREEVGNVLLNRGIIYAPDYVANAGGLISVADEYGHEQYDPERVNAKVMNIRNTMAEILSTSKKIGEATNFVANMMAEKVFNGYK